MVVNASSQQVQSDMKNNATNDQCPCGLGQDYSSCCQPIIDGARKAKTAEELMRSRYTAYTQVNIKHIEETQLSFGNNDFDAEEAAKWANDSDWLGLEVVKTKDGGQNDETGIVEFVAKYRPKQVPDTKAIEHHEVAEFLKKEGQWFFKSGQIVGGGTIFRDRPKVGRNSPCPCGSGKKFKRCCL